MSVLIRDPNLAAEVMKARAATAADRYTEVWNGVTVMPAVPNNEHQILVQKLSLPFAAVIEWDCGDAVMPGTNVSDRHPDWVENYRCPDVVVALAGGRAVDHHTHWTGGPDLVVEIESPSDDPRDKLDFYAAIGCREVLLIDRLPWAVVLYQLVGGRMVSAGRSELPAAAVVASGVLPLTFHLRQGKTRPEIVVTHPATGRTWIA